MNVALRRGSMMSLRRFLVVSGFNHLKAFVSLLMNSEIFVWSEQGLGDAIQFVRYIHLLHALGLKPVLSTRPSLVRLFRNGLSQRLR